MGSTKIIKSTSLSKKRESELREDKPSKYIRPLDGSRKLSNPSTIGLSSAKLSDIASKMRLRDRDEERKSTKTIDGLRERLVKNKVDLRKVEYLSDKTKIGASKAEVGYVKIEGTECFYKKVSPEIAKKY